MAFHIIASKKVKPCTCNSNCRAKYGQYATEPEALTALAELQGKSSSLTLKPIRLPEDEEAASEDAHGSDELFEDLMPIESNDEEPEVEPSVSKREEPRVKSSYFEEDEELLRGDDEVSAVTPSSALLTQLENVVSWRIDNLYDEDGGRRSRASLRANPPILLIEDAEGASAEFILTKHLTLTLSDAMEDVRRSYYGVNPRHGTSINPDEKPNKLREVDSWARNNPGRALAMMIFIALVVVTVVIL